VATRKEQVWLEEYLQCWNATEAARRAGYKWPNKYGPTKLAKFADEIAQRLRDKTMDADEVLARLADQARGNLADFIDTSVRGGMPDFESAEKRGLMHLLKSVTWTKDGVRIELYNAQAALVHIGKHLGLFSERHEITGLIETKDVSDIPDVERLAALAAVFERISKERDARPGDGDG
jgi:hypothetical protein